VGAARDLGDDAAEALVERGLLRDDAGQALASVADHRGSRLVAGTVDAED
jgi:hypothetical protein